MYTPEILAGEIKFKVNAHKHNVHNKKCLLSTT